jgi:type VI secretion system secreted protein VgrG
MASYTQENRLLSVSSVLGDDVLLLRSFTGHEAISRLFGYQLELLSENDAIAAKDLVGTSITWSVHEVDKGPRYFNGMVSRMVAGSMNGRGLRAYRVEVVPRLWFLTRTANCKIYQNKTTPTIIKSILGDFGISDLALKLTGKYDPREYCVQYRETAFNFVSRLMEQEGIFYFFQHDDGKHTLVLADGKSAFQDCVESSVRFSGGTLAPNHVASWEHQYEYRSGRWTMTNYNFETPSTSLLASTDTLLPLSDASKYEIFDYPGDHMKKSDGTAGVKLRMEEEEASFDVVAGSSQCCTFTPGGKFQLEDHEVASEQGKYVITAIQHTATETSYGDTSQGADYSNSFTCIPDSVTYRAPRLTPKPVVQGTQTAVVVGPTGEEIYTDRHGRIKVQFHWDREGKLDENSSCWIRVASPWAGKSWGAINIPRIGHEVVVDFLEGDPNRPLVIGSVYNGEYTTANTLPDSMNVSGLKSNSTKGGGGYNEISLDDTKGKEQITIHGQYDMNTTVEHDAALMVHNDRTISVDGTHTETITGETKIAITDGPYSHDVAANTASYHVKGDLTENYEANQDVFVGDQHSTTAKNTLSLNSEKAEIVITAAKKITLMVGKAKSCLVMDDAGNIQLSGRKIAINGTDWVRVDGSQIVSTGGAEVTMGVSHQTVTCDKTTVTVSGAAITSSAVGMHDITGAVVRIN